MLKVFEQIGLLLTESQQKQSETYKSCCKIHAKLVLTWRYLVLVTQEIANKPSFPHLCSPRLLRTQLISKCWINKTIKMHQHTKVKTTVNIFVLINCHCYTALFSRDSAGKEKSSLCNIFRKWWVTSSAPAWEAWG